LYVYSGLVLNLFLSAYINWATEAQTKQYVPSEVIELFLFSGHTGCLVKLQNHQQTLLQLVTGLNTSQTNLLHYLREESSPKTMPYNLNLATQPLRVRVKGYYFLFSFSDTNNSHLKLALPTIESNQGETY